MSKPRRVKGILGVPQSARPMLFTFQPNHEDNQWPSEDSDSDYIISDSEEIEQPEIEKKRKAINDAANNRPRQKRQKRESTKEKSSKSKHKKKEKKKKSRKSAKHSDSSSTSSDIERTGNKLSSSNSKQRQDRRDSTDGADGCQKTSELDQSSWGINIPLLALEKIFSFAIHGAGAVPFLCSLSRVCCLWRQAACRPMLWQHIDLANGRVKKKKFMETLKWLAANRFTQLRDISLAGWPKFSDEGLKIVMENCPKLEKINLTKCIGISASAVKTLAQTCTRLNAIDLSLLDGSDVMSPSNLKDLLETCGDRLQHLIMTQCMLRACPTVMKAITTNCKSLKTLDLCNCRFSTDFLGLPIEELQIGCPNLRVLRLAGCKVRAQQATSKAKAESPGFVHLRELSLAVSTETTINVSIGISDQFLTRIMKNSRKLQLLDLRGLTHISAKGVQSLTIDHLEHLYISQCSLSKYEGVEIVVQKWRHSLVELDLSWNVFPAMSLDVAMKKLSSGPSQSVLQTLNLSGTAITTDRVRSILEGCPNLVSVNLTSCRGLPRGMKRLHEKKDVKELGQQLGVTQKNR